MGAAPDYLEEIDPYSAESVELWDELPIWSAPFGLRLLDRVPMRTRQVILDLGPGTGFPTLELAQRCGPSCRVIAVDPWRPAMARLRRKVQLLGLDNITLLEQDAASLHLPDGSVDVVVSNLGINNFEDSEAVLRTCLRVSRPGAALLLTTNLAGHMAEFYAVYGTTLEEIGWVDRLAFRAHVEHRTTPQAATDLVQSAGFEIIEVSVDSFRMRFADGTALLRHHFIRRGFLPGWKSVVEGKDAGIVFPALERNLNALAAARGELSLTVPMACIEARKPAG